jgi:hypothetical protein
MTVIELLFEYLPERYIDAIVNNMNDRSQLYQEAGTFSSELMTLFDWESSKEGYEFWDEVLECALSNEELPEIPISIDYYPSTTFVCGKNLYVMNAAGTNINIVYDIKDWVIEKMEPTKKEKILAFVN